MAASNQTLKHTAEGVYQLKIMLKDSKPPIWRRVQVRAEITLAQLHEVIQLAMGWTDSHLHQFRVDGEMYSQPDFELDEFSQETNDENNVHLWRLVGLQDSFSYEYDFGDGWEHEIVVEKVLPIEEGVLYPRCLAGKRACPPEDVGGVWGYEEFLAAIKDPKHPEHREMLEWVGGSFDPADFDLAEVNLGLIGLSG